MKGYFILEDSRYGIPFFVDNYLIRSMDSFGVVVHVGVPVVRHREQLFERLSGAAFGRSQHPVGPDDDATASNSFEMHEPFMRAELGCLAFNDSDLLSIGDRDIISENKFQDSKALTGSLIS